MYVWYRHLTRSCRGSRRTENGIHLLCACAARKHWENIVGMALRLSPQR